jgi:nucleoside-diphosphate-sugar epimerase
MGKAAILRSGARERAGEGVRRAVLVTGAAGNIGSWFAEHCHRRYDLTLMIRPGEDGRPLERFSRTVAADLADLEGLGEVCRGVDTVLHLAGAAGPETPWETLLQANIIGTYNIHVAARAAGCRRLIYASSIHAVSGYPAGRQVRSDDPVNPGDLYGVSKCFGEAMGRYMAEQQQLSVVVLRIGAFQPPEAARAWDSVSMLDAFVSQRDLAQLIERCIDDERLQFAVFNGLSNNTFNRLDITDARELVGYAPEDDFLREHPGLRDLELAERLHTHSERSGQSPGIREDLGELERRAGGEVR